MAKKWYAIIIKNWTVSLGDASTTYFWMTSNSNNAQCRVYIPISGTIKSVICSFANTGVLWSSEQWSLRINRNTATWENLISSSVVNDAVNNTYTLSTNIPVTAGEYINIQWLSPTWATNPTNVNFNAYIRIE